MIVKPAQGGGSKDLFIIASRTEIELFKQTVNNDYFLSAGGINVEQFITGIMYYVDGLVYKQKIIFSWPSQYVNHTTDLDCGGWFGSVLLDQQDALTQKIQKYASKVICALPDIHATAFHLEFFVESVSKEFIFCEIACRPGGGLIRHVFNKVFGVDIVAEHLLLQSGQPPGKYPVTPTIYAGWLLLGARKELQLKSQEPINDLSIFFSDMWWQPGDVASKNAQGLANAMAQWAFTAENSYSAMQCAHRLAKWITSHTLWQACTDLNK